MRTPHGSVVRVRVRVRRIAERHNSAGQKVGKLEVLEEGKKAVDNRCSGQSGCLFRSPCCGNSSVLKLFLGGQGLSLRLCVHPCEWSDDLAIYAVWAVFLPTCGARQKVW